MAYPDIFPLAPARELSLTSVGVEEFPFDNGASGHDVLAVTIPGLTEHKNREWGVTAKG